MRLDFPAPNLPPARSRAMLAVLHRLPQGVLSRAFGRLADVPLPPPLRRPALGAFARAVGADPAEAEHPLERYRSLNAFFIRRLKPGARRWPEAPDVVGSPVDGTVGQVGTVRDGRALQAKGRAYSVAELLGDSDEGARFDDGTFATLYLSPKDYHRIHAPQDGDVELARHLPGGLLPVNAPAVAHLPDLFARNERLACHMSTPHGRLAVVAVGAYNVGRISAAFDSGWITNRRGAPVAARRYDPPVAIRQGDELMTFHLGSTVVLLWEPGRMELLPEVRPGATVRLGDGIARVIR